MRMIVDDGVTVDDRSQVIDSRPSWRGSSAHVDFGCWTLLGF